MTIKSLFSILIKLLKWSKLAAQMVATGAACSGAVEVLAHTSTAIGLLLGWMGMSVYAAYSALPDKGYDKTYHVPPRLPVKSVFKGTPMRLPVHIELTVRVPASQLHVIPSSARWRAVPGIPSPFGRRLG